MSNAANPSVSNGADLSAQTLESLRETETQTIERMMQHHDSLDDLGLDVWRNRDIVTYNILVDSLRRDQRFLDRVRAEITARENDVTIFDASNPIQVFCQ